MKSKLIFSFFVLVSFVGFLFSIDGYTDTNTNNEFSAFVIPVKGKIDKKLVSSIKKAIEKAEQNNISYLIFEINTFGGDIDSATKIRDSIIDAGTNKIHTVAFINKRAISAGALVAISCKKIVMAPGSTIGAAKPMYFTRLFSGTMQAADEKVVSYLRKEFSSTAETNGYSTDIVEAFVDQDKEIKDITIKGKLLTLTTEEALKYKVASLKAIDLDELLISLDLKNNTVQYISFKLNRDWMELIFWACAIAGTVFLLLRVVMMLIGGDLTGGDGVDVGDIEIDSDVAFEMFSINSITAFFMMFGWVGLTCYKEFYLQSSISILIAFAAGIFSMLVIVFIFRIAKKLVSTGSKFDINSTIGKYATVYQAIPADGQGRIQISIPGGFTRELNAISHDNEELKSFQSVHVVEVIDPYTVSVEKRNI